MTWDSIPCVIMVVCVSVCVSVCVCVCVCVLSRVQLCNSMDCSPLDSSVHGTFQARIQEQDAISFSGNLPNPGIKPASPALAGRIFAIAPPEKVEIVKDDSGQQWGAHSDSTKILDICSPLLLHCLVQMRRHVDPPGEFYMQIWHLTLVLIVQNSNQLT